jgi:drug/metabolite transporter (DMT)-like permease
MLYLEIAFAFLWQSLILGQTPQVTAVLAMVVGIVVVIVVAIVVAISLHHISLHHISSHHTALISSHHTQRNPTLILVQTPQVTSVCGAAIIVGGCVAVGFTKSRAEKRAQRKDIESILQVRMGSKCIQ